MLELTTTTARTLGELVAEDPARAAVLDELGIDYCCHGHRTLASACREAGLEPAAVAARLDTTDALATDDDVRGKSPEELVDHLETAHHRYLHDELPVVEQLAAKVLAAHGERHPELVEVQRLVTALRLDLEPHLMKEEAILFPAIRRLAAGETLDLRAPISVMNTEHESAGEILAALRSTTRDYTTPADGCASYQSLYTRLEEIERDTHVHIHEENNVLFPAVLAATA